jgi:hypothetical protein
MQGNVSQSQFAVNFNDSTYAQIDRAAGAVTIHQGQRLGLDSDWGGQIVAFLTLEQAEAIASVLYLPWSQPDEAYRGVQPAEDREDWVGA